MDEFPKDGNDVSQFFDFFHDLGSEHAPLLAPLRRGLNQMVSFEFGKRTGVTSRGLHSESIAESWIIRLQQLVQWNDRLSVPNFASRE
jgi:hypothetical protein